MVVGASVAMACTSQPGCVSLEIRIQRLDGIAVFGSKMSIELFMCSSTFFVLISKRPQENEESKHRGTLLT